jgi:hypothetical protein
MALDVINKIENRKFIWGFLFFSVTRCGDVDDHSMQQPQIGAQPSTTAPSGEDWRNINQLLDSLTDPSRYDRRSRPPPTTQPIHLNASLYISVMGGLNAQINVSMQMKCLRSVSEHCATKNSFKRINTSRF